MSVYDCLVYGDEVESILTAVSAARAGLKHVGLLRPSSVKAGAPLGGLVTRGGLAYMDLTHHWLSPLYKEFLDRAGVVVVSLAPEKAHTVLATMLEEAGVHRLADEVEISTVTPIADGWRLAVEAPAGSLPAIETRFLVDATPDGDLARALGVPYLEGMGGLFGHDRFLGISPVFTLSGVARQELIAFEADLRKAKPMPQWLEEALIWPNDAERAELITRPVFSPDEGDYVDILNPAIGVAFHQWRQRKKRLKTLYIEADAWIDGANTARLQDSRGKEIFSWNGLVSRVPSFNEAVALSHGAKPCPGELEEAMAAFEAYLQQEGGFPHASITPPQQLYVRQSCVLQARQQLTARQMLGGGVASSQTIGTFSYWLDCRGIVSQLHAPQSHLPKPAFNATLGCCLPKPELNLPRFAFVGRTAGTSPLGHGAGRIIQHNALLGEALGVAIAESVQAGHGEVAKIKPAAIREQLHARNGNWPEPEPKNLSKDINAATRPMLARDSALARRLAKLPAYHRITASGTMRPAPKPFAKEPTKTP